MQFNDPRLLRSGCYVAGEWISSDSDTFIDVINPANNEQIAQVPELTAEQVEAAINAAHSAFPAWAAKTAKERAAVLRKWFDLIIEHKEDLARLITYEMGKPFNEAVGEIVYGASFVEWFAEEGKRAYGDVIPSFMPDQRSVVIKQPVGVVAAITPWNFPVAMITRKCAPALAAGCTVLVKPAEGSPLSALALAELADRAGIPDGVLNIVTGNPVQIGKQFTDSSKIAKLSFTGSTQVGKLLMAQSASTVKKLSLELGGNAPFLIFDDANLDKAADGIMQSKFRNTGQTCVCTNRILVADSVHDALIDKLEARIRALKVGDGLDSGTEQGPLVNAAAVDKVEALVADAREHGARVHCGGERHALGGNYYSPTLISGATGEMRISREEIFGPVAVIYRFSTEADAVRMANDTEYGLAAYVYTRDIGRVWRVGEALQYGMVGLNSGTVSSETLPFGGVKESGIGREGSKYGLDEFLNVKQMNMAGIND